MGESLHGLKVMRRATLTKSFYRGIGCNLSHPLLYSVSQNTLLIIGLCIYCQTLQIRARNLSLHELLVAHVRFQEYDSEFLELNFGFKIW